MLTESDARNLLAKAAATIDVAPGAPIEVARRRTFWPMLVAAAAVLAVIGTAVLVGGLVGELGPSNDPPLSDSPSELPTPKSVLAPDQIPSVFAYDGNSARQLLEGLGLVVTTKLVDSCQTDGRAISTTPKVGSTFEPGDPVTLRVTDDSAARRCTSAPDGETRAWAFLDFANGRGPAPAFADEVTLYEAASVVGTLTAAEAADLASWPAGAAVDRLRRVSADVEEVREQGGQTFYLAPYLAYAEGRNDAAAGPSKLCNAVAAALEPRSALWVGTEFPSDGLFGCAYDVAVYQTDGLIDAVVVRPEHVQEAQPDPDPDGVAARFLAFARGQTDSLPIDTPVRLYLDNAYQRTITAAEAGEEDSWSLCSGVAPPQCQVSAVRVLKNFEHRPVASTQLQGNCVDTANKPPTDTGGSTSVVLSVPEPRTCADDFAVQLFSNDVGQITAVNLLMAIPDRSDSQPGPTL